MYIINIIVGRAMISYYKSQGMDFSCIADNPETFMEVCPIEPIQAYLKVSSLSQIIAELSVVAIVAFIFIKSIKLLFNSFKDKNTMKWYGLGLAIMYGGNYIYSMILTGLNLESTSSNQDAVNEIIFGTPLIGFLFVVIAAPLFEEIIFRFGIFRIFTHNNKKVETIGVILTTIAFAMVHMIATFSEVWADPAAPNYELLKSDLLSLPVYLIGAFGLTFAYHKSKSLATPMLMHMTYNGISFFALLLLGSLPEETGSIIINLFHLFL
jgi:membrane protease YdiL (CAAX protease family)